MAINTATAILGSAVLGAVGSASSASRQSRAAREATTAQTQAANQNLALQREVYNDSRTLQQPFYQAGLQGLYGSNGVMDLMGLGNGAMQAVPAQNAFASGSYGAQAPASVAFSGQAYLDANPDVAAYYRSNPKALAQFGGDLAAAAEYHYNTFGKAEGRQTGQPAPQAANQNTPVNVFAPAKPEVNGGTAPTNPDGTAAAPVDPRTQSLRNTPGYQFQVDEARRGVENSFAGRGKLLSGAAMTALSDRTQGLADNTYNQTLQNAFQLTSLGTGAASNIGAAGQNYAAGAGGAYTNAGTAAANGAYGRADATTAGWQGVSNAFAGGLGAYGAYRGWGGTSGGTRPPAARVGSGYTDMRGY